MQSIKRFVLAGWLSLSAATCLSGCSTIILFDPKGPIGDSERFVILAAIGLMLIVITPVFIMAFWFPLKYRASNTQATYQPKWSYSAKIDLVMWGVPMAIVTVLAILAWNLTHALDPYKPIPSAQQPLNIQAVSLDWKWLFIYPEQNIAAVNQLTFPVQVPLSFKITSDTVMTSFFIPQLGSQIYARVQKVRQSKELLDLKRYEQLARPNRGYYPVTYFSAVAPDLFLSILRKYDPAWGKNPGAMSRGPGSPSARADVAGEN
jgi:cytochrome o ubiquinol oxidase subunit 2